MTKVKKYFILIFLDLTLSNNRKEENKEESNNFPFISSPFKKFNSKSDFRERYNECFDNKNLEYYNDIKEKEIKNNLSCNVKFIFLIFYK